MKKIIIVISQEREKTEAWNKLVDLGYDMEEVDFYVKDGSPENQHIIDLKTVKDLAEKIENDSYDEVYLYSVFLAMSTMRDLMKYLNAHSVSLKS